MADLLDILRVTAYMTAGVDQDQQNVYYLRVEDTGGVDDGDVLDDMAEYCDNIYTEINGIVANNIEYLEVKTSNITAGIDIGVTAFPTLTTGGVTNQMLPNGVSALAKAFPTVLGHIGKKFWPSFTVAAMDDGLFNSGAVTASADAAQAAYEPFVSTLGNHYQPIIYDRTNEVAHVPESWSASSNPAYQRRRRPGTGS